MTYINGIKKGKLVFLRCSGQGTVQCRLCNRLSWVSTSYARINKDNGYDYYCRNCAETLSTTNIKTDENTNKRELYYIKKKGLKLW